MRTDLPGTPAGSEALRTLIADGLERARHRTHALTECDEEDLLKQHWPLMAPLVWDLAPPPPGDSGSWAMWQDRAPACDVDQMSPPSRHAAAAAGRPALLSPAVPKVHRPGPRQGARYPGTDPFGRITAGETWLRLRNDHPARAAARRNDAGHAPAEDRNAGPARKTVGGQRPAPGPGCAAEGGAGSRPVHHGNLGGAVGAGQRTPGPYGGRSWLLDRRGSGDQRRLPVFHRRRRLPDPVGGPGRAGIIAGKPGWWLPSTGNAMVADGPGPGLASLNPCPMMSQCSTCAGSKRTPMPVGPGAGCQPKRNGKRRRAMIPRPAVHGVTHGATKTPHRITQTLAERPSAQLPPAPFRQVPRRWGCASSSAMSGSGSPATRSTSGLQCVPLSGIQRSVFRLRLQGSPGRLLGGGPCRVPGNVPQLGLPDPAPDLAGFRTARDATRAEES